MPRIPPAVLALAAAAAVAGIVVGLAVAFGQKGTGPVCSAAQAAGPYGCVTFVSLSGTQSGRAQSWLADGTAMYSVERDTDGFTLVSTGGCNRTTVPVAVARSTYRSTGDAATTAGACPADAASHDRFMALLFTGTAHVIEHEDATVTVTNGERTAVFQEVLAAR